MLFVWRHWSWLRHYFEVKKEETKHISAGLHVGGALTGASDRDSGFLVTSPFATGSWLNASQTNKNLKHELCISDHAKYALFFVIPSFCPTAIEVHHSKHDVQQVSSFLLPVSSLLGPIPLLNKEDTSKKESLNLSNKFSQTSDDLFISATSFQLRVIRPLQKRRWSQRLQRGVLQSGPLLQMHQVLFSYFLSPSISLCVNLLYDK